MTRHLHPTRLPWLLLVCLVAFAAAAEPSDISVSLDQPDPYTPARGPVEIVAFVSAQEPLQRVSFYVDGVVVAELAAPPWQVITDVGPENLEHEFRVVAYGLSGALGQAAINTPRIRVDDELSVELQQLFVTVTSGGRRVADLQRGDFEVFDEGSRREIVTFALGEIPFTAVILLDSSFSMVEGKLEAAVSGARAFANGMRRLDEGKLLVFSDRILRSTPFTSFPEVLTNALDGLAPRGGTALNDHLFVALKRLEERQGRRVVVVLSDGVDSHSVLRSAEVQRKARFSQAMIYWLRLRHDAFPHIASSWRSPAEYESELTLLSETVVASGGRVVPIEAPEEIEAAFRDILAELREQYALGFYPPPSRRSGSWRRVRIDVRRGGVDVRAPEGYLEP